MGRHTNEGQGMGEYSEGYSNRVPRNAPKQVLSVAHNAMLTSEKIDLELVAQGYGIELPVKSQSVPLYMIVWQNLKLTCQVWLLKPLRKKQLIVIP